MPEIDPPDLSREVTYSVRDHESLLSFNADEDAELFEEWWNLKGWELFQKWALKARKAVEKE